MGGVDFLMSTKWPNPAMQRTGSVRHGRCSATFPPTAFARSVHAALRRSLILFSLGAYLHEFATFNRHQHRENLWHERQQILEAIALGAEHDNRDF
jgi:lysozyme family protein